jgi:hypothetical protein
MTTDETISTASTVSIDGLAVSAMMVKLVAQSVGLVVGMAAVLLAVTAIFVR